MKDKLTPKVVAALGAVAVAAVALIGWFALVSPQRSKTSDLDRQIADAKMQLVVAQATARRGSGPKGASALVLSRAMPGELEMPAVLRQLIRTANRNNVSLDAVTPQAATTLTNYSVAPMNVVVSGGYFGIQRFLQDLRTSAGVVGSHVHASGRLFSVDSVSLAPGQGQLPQLSATIQLNVFTYSGPGAPSTAAATPLSTQETAPASSTSSTRLAAGGTN
jgi:hypothetical protein